MAGRGVGGDDLAGLRSSLAADVASLAGPSFTRSRQGERGRSPSPSAQSGAEIVQVTVNLNGGAVFLDDERRMRLLAREIKRLIIEDIRRGIDV